MVITIIFAYPIEIRYRSNGFDLLNPIELFWSPFGTILPISSEAINSNWFKNGKGLLR